MDFTGRRGVSGTHWMLQPYIISQGRRRFLRFLVGIEPARVANHIHWIDIRQSKNSSEVFRRTGIYPNISRWPPMDATQVYYCVQLATKEHTGKLQAAPDQANGVLRTVSAQRKPAGRVRLYFS